MPKTKSKPKKAAPAIVTDFALVDIKQGRKAVAKLIANDHRIPVTLTGYLMPHAGNIGNDDGTSIEFAMCVEKAEFGTPVKRKCDHLGREYARLSELDLGVKIDLDGGFDCREGKRNSGLTVHGDANGMFFACDEGRHYLSGQIDDDDGDTLIGVYVSHKQPKAK